MFFTAQQLADHTGGKLSGSGDIKIYSPAKIEEAKDGEITFLANPKYLEYVYSTNASLLIVSHDISFDKPVKSMLLRVKDAYTAFTQVLEKFSNSVLDKKGIEEPSFISKSATLGKDVYVGAMSYIGDNVKLGNNVKIFPGVFVGEQTSIGDNTIIFSDVTLYHHSQIGKNCIIHSGTIIGSDGFGFAPLPDGSYKKIPQLGNVLIEDNVEIGANTVIDRATMGSTIIHKGVKLDNLIQVAHNVEIGENTVVAAQTGISGSTRIGKNCVIGGQVGFVGHLDIADGTRINAQSGVSKSVNQKGKALTGSPAYDYTASLRSQAIFRSLPQLEKRIAELEKQLEKLKNPSL
jgi:UDP-3-O-[3-hydroxymyristoyl] glucosamine N-acyltransferase